MPQRITIDDFFTGLFAALAAKRYSTISLRRDRLDRALDSVFKDLFEHAGEKDLDLRFRIRIHPTHQDSITVRNGIYNAVQRDLISLDNPEYQDIRLRIQQDEAVAVLERLPGGRTLYDDLADSFLKQYDAAAA